MISVFRVDGTSVRDTGVRLQLPGHPGLDAGAPELSRHSGALAATLSSPRGGTLLSIMNCIAPSMSAMPGRRASHW